jgi:hypothetical protein
MADPIASVFREKLPLFEGIQSTTGFAANVVIFVAQPLP